MSCDSEYSIQYCACFRLRAAARKVTRDFEEALRPAGLKATQFTLLSMIQGMKPNSLTLLADHVGMDRTALNRALNIMIKNSWVTVQGNAENLEKQVRITHEGAAVLEMAVPLWQEVQKKFIEQSHSNDWPSHRDWLISIAGGQHYGT